MRTETFETKYGDIPVNVEIDEDGIIMGITMKGTDVKVNLTDEQIEHFQDDNSHLIHAVLEENKREALEWERHIRIENTAWRKL